MVSGYDNKFIAKELYKILYEFDNAYYTVNVKAETLPANEDKELSEMWNAVKDLANEYSKTIDIALTYVIDKDKEKHKVLMEMTIPVLEKKIKDLYDKCWWINVRDANGGALE